MVRVQAQITLVFIVPSSTHSYCKCPYSRRTKLSITPPVPSGVCTGFSVSSSLSPVAVTNHHKHRCYYWKGKEHLPSSLPLCSTITLPTWAQAACQLPTSLGLFLFPWLCLHPHPRALHSVMNELLPAGERQTSQNFPQLYERHTRQQARSRGKSKAAQQRAPHCCSR